MLPSLSHQKKMQTSDTTRSEARSCPSRKTPGRRYAACVLHLCLVHTAQSLMCTHGIIQGCGQVVPVLFMHNQELPCGKRNACPPQYVVSGQAARMPHACVVPVRAQRAGPSPYRLQVGAECAGGAPPIPAGGHGCAGGVQGRQRGR